MTNEAPGCCGMYATEPPGPLLSRGWGVPFGLAAGILAIPGRRGGRALLFPEADGSVAGRPFGLTAGVLSVSWW
ncbi:hypothetical protein Pcatena_06200 [Parolsenella catena]|uniref:Uncharacterized protein n=1 Tax=Parolsenella catena TaxID=2003188 RepID=A0A3G9JXC9_9ACTN|nr:hypothetical protein Pcatena_06200 [Parolsenella catena]